METSITKSPEESRAIALFYEYLHLSGRCAMTVNGEERLGMIDNLLGELGFIIVVDEENSKEVTDDIRGIEYLLQPAQLIRKNRPDVVLEQDVLVFSQISEALPQQSITNEFDLRFLKDAGISIR